MLLYIIKEIEERGNNGIETRFLEKAYDILGHSRYRELFCSVPRFHTADDGMCLVETDDRIHAPEKDLLERHNYNLVLFIDRE